jgi:hypothetical protein
MPADAPRATAEDGFTPGDRPGDDSTERSPEFGAGGSRPPAPEGGRRDIDAEDAGDPAEFAEPSPRTSTPGSAPAEGDPGAHGAGFPSGPPPDLPNFVGRSGDEQGEPTNGSGLPGGPDADGIPPPPTLDPTVVGPGGPLPPPAHLRPQSEVPAAQAPLSAIRLPRLPRLRRGEGKAPGRRQARVRGARVNQRLWRFDPWSVFKVSALFYLCLFFILLVAGTLLWNVGRSSGTIDQIESFVTRLGAYGNCVAEDEVPEGADFENDEDCPDGSVLVNGFELDDGTIFKAALIGGIVLVGAGAVGNVLMTVLLNLINEVSGGMRYTIIKEPAPRPAATGAGPPAGATGPPGSGAGAGGPPAPDGSTRVRVRR